MSSSQNLGFKKLNGRENYDTWKISAKSYLTIKGYWKWMQAELSSSSSATDIENEAKARSELTLLLDESMYSYIDEDDTAKKQWESLKAAFEDSGLTRKVAILQKLVSLKLNDCDSMEDYINRMVSLWSKVKRVGFKIDEEIIGSLMLGGLPDEYTPMVMGIENSGKKITVDSVKTILLQEVKFESKNDESALATKMKGKSKKFSKEKIRCYECNEIGHIARNCTKKRKKSDRTRKTCCTHRFLCKMRLLVIGSSIQVHRHT